MTSIERDLTRAFVCALQRLHHLVMMCPAFIDCEGTEGQLSLAGPLLFQLSRVGYTQLRHLPALTVAGCQLAFLSDVYQKQGTLVNNV